MPVVSSPISNLTTPSTTNAYASSNSSEITNYDFYALHDSEDLSPLSKNNLLLQNSPVEIKSNNLEAIKQSRARLQFLKSVSNSLLQNQLNNITNNDQLTEGSTDISIENYVENPPYSDTTSYEISFCTSKNSFSQSLDNYHDSQTSCESGINFVVNDNLENQCEHNNLTEKKSAVIQEKSYEDNSEKKDNVHDQFEIPSHTLKEYPYFVTNEGTEDDIIDPKSTPEVIKKIIFEKLKQEKPKSKIFLYSIPEKKLEIIDNDNISSSTKEENPFLEKLTNISNVNTKNKILDSIGDKNESNISGYKKENELDEINFKPDSLVNPESAKEPDDDSEKNETIVHNTSYEIINKGNFGNNISEKDDYVNL